ncbi:MAG: DUF1893 domain-containing protein [Clostridiales bacterium]|nr:DUF1893 domain-containing protein [Clostridiales bacterium]
MRDIDIAKEQLKNNEYTLVIAKNSSIIYNSKNIGIYPIYDAATSKDIDTKDSSVADKVTGKGAALLCAYARIKCLYTGLISRSALKVLEDNGIEVSYDKLVEYIKNRTGDGRCPVESMSDSIEKPEDLLKPVKEFLVKTGMI